MPSRRWQTGGVQLTEGLGVVLRGAARVARRLVLTAAVIGSATFLTGRWVIGTGAGWTIVGGVLCGGPVVAAALAWVRLAAAEHASRTLADEVARLDGTTTISVDATTTIIVGGGLARLDPLRDGVRARPDDFPGLVALLGTLSRVPALVAIALLGMCAAGALGTVLLIGGLID